MLNAVFYGFVVLGALCGFQRGAAKAGYDFTAVGMGVYFAVWLLPLSLLVMDYVPSEYTGYAFPALLLGSAILLFSLIKTGITALLDNYPIFDSEVDFSESPVANGLFGGLFGAATGFFAISFILFLATFSPVELPYVSTKESGGYADEKILKTAEIVNYFAGDEWNARQKSYLQELTGKYRTYGKAQVPPAEEKKDAPQNDKPAADNNGSAGTGAAPAAAPVENQGQPGNSAQKPAADAGTAPSAPAQQENKEQGKTAPQQLASKAVNAAASGQEKAMKLMTADEKKAVVPDGAVKDELVSEGGKIVRQALKNKKGKASDAASGVVTAVSEIVSGENAAAPTPVAAPIPESAPASAGTITTAPPVTAAENESAASPQSPAKEAAKPLPGVAAPWSVGSGPREIPGVTFTLLIPEVNEDGTNTIHTRGIKVGIRLTHDGKVPKVIDLYVPHPIRFHRDRVIYRRIRVDMSMVTYAHVRNLRPELDTRYEVVESE